MTKRKRKSNTNAYLQKSLVFAVQEGNLGLVQNIIDNTCLSFASSWLQGYTLLCSAIKCNRSQIALWLISIGCKVNRVDDNDTSDTPLHLAIDVNNNSLVKILIEKGACTNVRNAKGETPLHISCQRKNIAITRLLLNNNCIADIADLNLTTPLHIAVENKCFETIKLLLKHKVNINFYTYKKKFKGCNSLHIATIKKNEKIVKILLENGADINSRIRISDIENSKTERLTNYVNYKDYMPLHIATELNNYNIVKLLLHNGANVNAIIENNDLTSLHIAVTNRNEMIVKLFSQYSANFQARTKDGKSIIHLAVENDWPFLVNVLLKKNTNINDQNNYGETLLHIAVKKGNENMIKLLLKHNANINITNIKNESPLHIAAKYSENISKILLKIGANIDEVNSNNETPLSIAIKQKQISIIKVLLQYRPSIDNVVNRSAFIFVVRNIDYSNMRIFYFLLEYGFKIFDEDIDTNLLNNFVSQGYFGIVKYFLENKVNFSYHSENKKKSLLLNTAVLNQNIEMVELLIKHKCNLNTIDHYGQTPIGYAIQYGNLNILNFLLTNGAKIENITYPMFAAAKDNNIYLIRFLLEHGVNINVRDEFNTTIIHFAVWNKNKNFVEFLLKNQVQINAPEKNLTNFDNNISTCVIDSYTNILRKHIFTSPLHIAVKKNSKDICINLLEHYANINCIDGHSRTPLHIASAIKSADQIDIIKLLFNYGANINALDAYQRLPIYYVYNQTCVCSIAFQNQYDLYSECECYLYEEYDINSVISLFIKHIMLLLFMNKYVHADNINILSQCDFTENLKFQCLLEISKMKVERINDCISVYDLLVKKSNAMTVFASNDNVVQAFKFNDYKNKFPLYFEILIEKFQLAQVRAELIRTATVSINNLLKFKLPEVITEKIFDLLHLNDLNSISLANSLPF